MNAVRVRADAAFPAESVKVTVQVYAASPSVDNVMVLEPDDIAEVELRPHPEVPPTAIVPASATLIVTSGVVSGVGVVAAVDSLAAATVKSAVTAPESAEVSADPTLPAASVWLPQENTVDCSVSSPLRVNAAVQEVPEPPIVAVSPSIVHASAVTASLAVIVRVIVSPLFANPLLLLLVVIAMVDRVGCVLSIVTLLESVTADTAEPALPAVSLNAIENVIAPLASASAVVTVQDQDVPEPDAVTELSMVAPAPSLMVHVGEPMASEDVIEIVTTSPLLAFPSPAVAIDTADSVGTLASMMTAPRSPEAAAAAPPAASAMVPVYAETATSVSSVSPEATVVVKTSAVEPDPLEYAAESPLSSVSAPLLVTTASPHVHVIVRTSPIL